MCANSLNMKCSTSQRNHSKTACNFIWWVASCYPKLFWLSFKKERERRYFAFHIFSLICAHWIIVFNLLPTKLIRWPNINYAFVLLAPALKLHTNSKFATIPIEKWLWFEAAPRSGSQRQLNIVRKHIGPPCLLWSFRIAELRSNFDSISLCQDIQMDWQWEYHKSL